VCRLAIDLIVVLPLRRRVWHVRRFRRMCGGFYVRDFDYVAAITSRSSGDTLCGCGYFALLRLCCAKATTLRGCDYLACVRSHRAALTTLRECGVFARL
jgi:hypothetical protein